MVDLPETSFDPYILSKPFVELEDELANVFGGRDKIPERIRYLVDLIFERYERSINDAHTRSA